jgi:D-xylose 1-dehydrogenase (NADP+, D-xylono-1,5-lactone-forming)
VLGAADIARIAVLPAIAASRNGRLVALASRSLERARSLVAPYAGAEALASYAEVLEDPRVDAVYVPLPNSLHAQWSIRALEAGKHVLCEKPLATDAPSAQAMAAAAAAAGRCLMEAFMYRFHPAMREFLSRVREPIHVSAGFGFTLAGASDIRAQAALGGGALLDVGCYTVNVARWILGEPTEVTARARSRGGIDMSVTVLLGFEDGATASLWASFESPEQQDLTVIGRSAVARRERPFTAWRDPDDPYRLMVESFADSVLLGVPVAIPPADSIANMALLDRIRAGFTSRPAP